MSTTYQKCSWAYGNFVTIVSALRSPLLLAIRLYWGFQFAQTGWGKLQHLRTSDADSSPAWEYLFRMPTRFLSRGWSSSGEFC